MVLAPIPFCNPTQFDFDNNGNVKGLESVGDFSDPMTIDS